MAGPNTSPTTAITVLAVKTAQNDESRKMSAAAPARMTSATTITPRFARLLSIAAPMGV